MPSNDSALRGTGAAPELWGAVYMMLVFALFSRAFHAWMQYSGQPIGWQQTLEVGIPLVLCPAPLLMGIAFRRLIKSELSKGQLTQRTFKICNFWIAQLVILAYITMVI
ncbi:MAG TPA: hypothetical protein VGG56_17910 [Terracidiphilus sp.]|jgi:hypothetical protein